jgi:hypothetical protein
LILSLSWSIGIVIDRIKGKITGISPEGLRRGLDIITTVKGKRLPVVIAEWLKVCCLASETNSRDCLKDPPILKHFGYCHGKTAAM